MNGPMNEIYTPGEAKAAWVEVDESIEGISVGRPYRRKPYSKPSESVFPKYGKRSPQEKELLSEPWNRSVGKKKGSKPHLGPVGGGANWRVKHLNLASSTILAISSSVS